MRAGPSHRQWLPVSHHDLLLRSCRRGKSPCCLLHILKQERVDVQRALRHCLSAATDWLPHT